MTDIEYLSIDHVIEINADQAGGTLQDRAGLESALHRPKTDYFEVELFPTVWSKAAAYLHGLAGPQYFSDGNKRTGWFAAATFLKGNGYPIPSVPAIEAETFVQAVAQEVYDSAETRPEFTLAKAAEWFESKWDNQRPGPATDPRLEYAFLALHWVDNAGTYDAYRAGSFGIDPPTPFPAPTPFWVVGRLHWDKIDPIRSEHEIMAKVVTDDGFRDAARPQSVLIVKGYAGVPSGHAHHRTGQMPLIFGVWLNPVFRESCTGNVMLSLNGDLIATLPFLIHEQPKAPASAFVFPLDLMPD